MYDLFLGAALMVWIIGLPVALKAGGLPMPRSLLPGWGCIPFALLGARLLNFFLYPEWSGWQTRIFSLTSGAFTVYGGVLLAALFVMVICRLLHLPVWRFLDISAPVAGLSMAVSRIGCTLTGCCFGIPTTLPWGIVPDYGGVAHQLQLDSGLVGRFMGLPLSPLPIHPTQVYELFAALAAAALSVWLLRRHAPDGVPSTSFGLLLSMLRLLIFQVRAFPGASELSLLIRGPVIFGMGILLSGMLLYLKSRKTAIHHPDSINLEQKPPAS